VKNLDNLVVREARYWLLDCGADPDDVATASDYEVYREVERQYEGGWSEFVRTFREE
jgi:hypothetical protein